MRKIKKYVADDENFMLTYGDGVGNIDIDHLVAFHQATPEKILTVYGCSSLCHRGDSAN